MAQHICVFDLDNTLGDFRIIDYFGVLLEPKIIPNHYRYNNDIKEEFLKIIDSYSKEEKDLLLKLRNSLEKEIEKEGLTEKILRPNLKQILEQLVNQYNKHKIQGFIIYSNNANLYVLEYAGRAIQNMFHTPNLFIKYLDRNHEEREKFDKLDQSGYPSKMVNTIRQYSNGKILFIDDLIHNDFYIDYENVTYIQIPPFETDADTLDLQMIITIFEDIFDTLSKEEINMFFNLYHMKHILQIHNFDEIKKQYLEYSKERKSPKEFKENLPMIEEKIQTFIKKISTNGGKKRQRKTRKNSSSKCSTKKRKYSK
jgi:hypothetical protein